MPRNRSIADICMSPELAPFRPLSGACRYPEATRCRSCERWRAMETLRSRATASISSHHLQGVRRATPRYSRRSPGVDDRFSQLCDWKDHPGDDGRSSCRAWPRRVSRWADAAVCSDGFLHRRPDVGGELSVTDESRCTPDEARGASRMWRRDTTTV